MDRKPLARAQSREIRITFRLTKEEAASLHEEAAVRDVELSRLIRRWLSMGKRMDDVMPERKVARA